MRGARVCRSTRDAIGRRHVDGVEVLPAALVEDAGQIDDRVRACDGASDRLFVTHVGLDRHDLADIAAWAQESGKFRPPRRNADAVALLREPLDDMAPEKPGSTEDCDDSQLGPARSPVPLTRPVY